MSAVTWALIATWALSFPYAFRVVFREMASGLVEGPGTFLFLVFAVAYFAAIIAPFAVAWRAFTALTLSVDWEAAARSLGGEDDEAKVERLEREARERERHIAELERELELA